MPQALFKCFRQDSISKRRSSLGLPRRSGTLSSADSEDIFDESRKLAMDSPDVAGGGDSREALVNIGVLEVKSKSWPHDSKLLLHDRGDCVFTRHFRIRPNPGRKFFVTRLNCEINIMCEVAKEYLFEFWKAIGHLMHPETIYVDRVLLAKRLVHEVISSTEPSEPAQNFGTLDEALSSFEGLPAERISRRAPSRHRRGILISATIYELHWQFILIPDHPSAAPRLPSQPVASVNSGLSEKQPVLSKPEVLFEISIERGRYTLCAGADDTSGSPSNEALWQIVAVDKEMKPPRKGLMSATIGRARSTLNRPLQTVRRKLPGGTTPYISTYLEKGDVLRFGSLRLIIADVMLDFSAQRRTAHSSQMTTLSVSRNQSGDFSNDASSASLRDLSESGHGTSVCRICFDEESPDDPLLRPCDCKGSVKFVHKNCLQRWVEGQMRVRQLHHGGGEYLLVPMKCEICQQLYHDHAYSPELLPRPVCPHVVLEEEPTYHRGTGQMIGRKIHIVPFPKPNYVATVGRSKDCDVLLTDIGVSRSHAAMKFSQNRILLVDRGSKFGTLRKLNDDKVELQTGRTFAVQHSSSMLEFSVSKVLKYRLFPERYLPPVLSSEEAEQSRLRACSPDSIDSEIMDDAGIQAQLARLFPETGVRMYRSTLPSHAAIEQAWQPRARQNEQENYSLRLIRGLPTTRWPEDVAELNAASFVAGTGPRTAMNAIERALVAPAVRRLSYSQVLPARDEVRAPRRAFTLPQIIGRLPTTTSNFVLPLQMPGLDSEVSHEAQTARNIADSTLGRYSARRLEEVISPISDYLSSSQGSGSPH